MPRRKNHTGCIRQRGDSYEASIMINGKRMFFTEKTKQEAERKLLQLRQRTDKAEDEMTIYEKYIKRELQLLIDKAEQNDSKIINCSVSFATEIMTLINHLTGDSDNVLKPGLITR